MSEAGFFKDMFALPQPVDEGDEKTKEGTTDDTAITIPDVTCKEFEALLDFFYYRLVLPYHVRTLPSLWKLRKGSKDEARSLDQWVSLLSISTRFQLDRIRRLSEKSIGKNHALLLVVRR